MASHVSNDNNYRMDFESDDIVIKYDDGKTKFFVLKILFLSVFVSSVLLQMILWMKHTLLVHGTTDQYPIPEVAT